MGLKVFLVGELPDRNGYKPKNGHTLTEYPQEAQVMRVLGGWGLGKGQFARSEKGQEKAGKRVYHSRSEKYDKLFRAFPDIPFVFTDRHIDIVERVLTDPELQPKDTCSKNPERKRARIRVAHRRKKFGMFFVTGTKKMLYYKSNGKKPRWGITDEGILSRTAHWV